MRLYRMGGRALPETAREVGVSGWTIARSLRQADTCEGKAEGLTSEEREEGRSLRRENRIPKEEKEILRKAALFLAREQDLRRWGFL